MLCLARQCFPARPCLSRGSWRQHKVRVLHCLTWKKQSMPVSSHKVDTQQCHGHKYPQLTISAVLVQNIGKTLAKLLPNLSKKNLKPSSPRRCAGRFKGHGPPSGPHAQILLTTLFQAPGSMPARTVLKRTVQCQRAGLKNQGLHCWFFKPTVKPLIHPGGRFGAFQGALKDRSVF